MIIENNKFDSIIPNKLTAKQYIRFVYFSWFFLSFFVFCSSSSSIYIHCFVFSLLDNYSSGEVSRRIESIFSPTSLSPSLLNGGSNRRNRRSSFDSMTGLSIGYLKRRLVNIFVFSIDYHLIVIDFSLFSFFFVSFIDYLQIRSNDWFSIWFTFKTRNEFR